MLRKADAPVMENVGEKYTGAFISVPSLLIQCDLSKVALEHVIWRYEEAFGSPPNTCLYSKVDRDIMHRLRYGDLASDIIRTTIHYWVELPLNGDMWAVVGEEGMVLLEGA